MDNSIKKKADKFAYENSLTNINYSSLKEAAENLGYTLIEFNTLFNDSDTDSLIKALKLGDVILHSRGFTYADSNFRLIFINEILNETEKLYVLAHELGHIACKHFGSNSVIGNDVNDEHEANEFSHYLINASFKRKFAFFFKKINKKTLIASALVIVAAVFITGTLVSNHNKRHYSEFYVSANGVKYHKKECMTIKGRKNVRQLSKKEFDSKKYSPCNVCLPN